MIPQKGIIEELIVYMQRYVEHNQLSPFSSSVHSELIEEFERLFGHTLCSQWESVVSKASRKIIYELAQQNGPRSIQTEFKGDAQPIANGIKKFLKENNPFAEPHPRTYSMAVQETSIMAHEFERNNQAPIRIEVKNTESWKAYQLKKRMD